MRVVFNEELYVQPYCGHNSGLKKIHREGLVYHIAHFCYTFKDQALINQRKFNFAHLRGPATEKSLSYYLKRSDAQKPSEEKDNQAHWGLSRPKDCVIITTTSFRFSE